MNPHFILRDFDRSGRAVRRWLVGTTVLTVLSGATFGQTAPTLAIPPGVSDPVAGALCLAGEGCGGSAASACVAEQTIKTVPPALRAEALAFSQSKPAEDCRAATAVLAQEREKLRELYERNPLAPFSDEDAKSLRNYAAACLSSPQMALNHGRVTPAQAHFLRDHTGLIVRRDNPDWLGPQGICQGARFGRFIVTAQRCIPSDLRTKTRPSEYILNLGFRFFDSPTIYGLRLHQLGTDKDPRAEQQRDYAIFEIPGAPSLEEDIAPLLGTMQPFDDFVTMTAHITAVWIRGLRTGAAKDLNSITTIQKNTLCRPSYIAPNGLFLHGCLIDSALSTGAPLFQRQSGRLVFVGMHIGDTVSLREPSLAACAPGLNKYGIAIPPSVLREAFSK